MFSDLTYVHLMAAILASWRLTELFAVDRITEFLRLRFPLYLWTCIRCLSVWMGAIVTIAFIYFPWANWPFALSMLYLWGKEKHFGLPRDTVILKNINGGISMERQGMLLSTLRDTLKQALTFSETKIKE